ncbi:MAG: hypothetical protein ABIX10_14965 [Acidimicrobiales bacterium]
MDGRILVTAVGGLGWAAAVGLIVRWRSTRRVARVDPADPNLGSRVAASVARASGSVAAALLAGALVLGLGGRFLMRVLAATSPEAAQGRITDADEVVGSVTLGGTIGLIVFVGLAGGLAGLALYALLRRWLPDRSMTAGLVVGGIGAGLLARPTGLLNPENRDFDILTPTWLAVALALALLVTFALLAAVLVDRWGAGWPRPGRSPKGVAAVLPLVPLLLAPPAAAVVACAIVLGSSRRGQGARAYTPADRLLRRGLVLAAAIGTAWTLVGASEILT